MRNVSNPFVLRMYYQKSEHTREILSLLFERDDDVLRTDDCEMLNCFRIQVSSYLFEPRGTRVQRDGSLIIQAKLINCVKSRGTHPEVDQCRSATN